MLKWRTEQKGAEMSEGKARLRWTKWLFRMVLVLVAVAALAAALLMTGWPQRTLLVKLVGDALKANVEITGLSLLGDVKFDELKAFDKTAAASSKPMLDVSGATIGYTLLPPGEKKRYISSVSIDNLAVNIDRSKPAPPPPAPEAKPAAPEKPKPGRKKREKRGNMPFIPEAVNVANMQFDFAAPTIGMQIAGLRLGAKIEGSRDYEASIDGNKVSGSWWTASREAGSRFSDGTISVQARKSGKETAIEPLSINLPGVLEIAGYARLKEGGQTDIDFNLERFLASSMDLSSVSPDVLRVPFRFKKLDMSGTRLKVTAALKEFKASTAGTKFNVAAEDLALGPKGREFYEGNLTITGSGGTNTDLQLDLEAALNRNQKLLASLSGIARDFGLHASMPNWSREDLRAVLPKDVRGTLDALPGLQSLNAAVDLNVKFMTYEMKGTANPVFSNPDGTAGPVEFSMDVKGSTVHVYMGALQCQTSLGAKVGNGSVSLSTMIGPAPRNKVKVALDRLDPGRCLRTLTQRRDLDDLSAALSGTLDFDVSKDWKDIKLAIDLTGSPFRYGPVVAPEGKPLKVTGNITADNSVYWKLAIPALDVRVGDQASVAFKDTTIDIESITVKSDVTAECNLAMLGHGLRGNAKLHAPTKNERGYATADIDLSVDGFGFGAFVLPPGAPLSAKGVMVYDNINGRTKSGNLDLKHGEGTSLALSNISCSRSPFRIETAFALKSDLQVLVGTGWLDAAKGTASVSGVFKHEEGQSSATFDLDVACESMALTQGLGALDGVSVKGPFAWAVDKGISGSGDLKVAKLAIGSIVLSEVASPLQAEGDAIKATGLAGKAFDGTFAGDAEVGVLRPGRPVRLNAQLKAVNLDSMSRDLAVPSLKVTGPADGTLTFAMDQEGIKEFQFNLQSTASVTISTAFLEQLLALPYLQEIKGKDLLERIVKEGQGKDGQTQLDSASLALVYGGDRYTLTVTLVIGARSVTTDVLIDATSVMTTLKLIRQLGNSVPAQPQAAARE